MKKIFAIILVIALAFSMVACAKEKTPNTVTPDTSKTDTNVNNSSNNNSEDSIQKAAMDYFSVFDKNHMISWDDVLAMVDAGDEPFILSIRAEKDYKEGHVKGAYLASFGEDLSKKVSMLPKDKPVYVYCYTGQTSNQAVAVLNLLGIDAYSVNGGVNNGLKKLEGYEKYMDTTSVELSNAGAEFDADLLAFAQNYFKKIATDGNNIIPVDKILGLVEAADAIVVDIRKAEDYANGHVEGAINVPFGKGMQEKFADLPKDKQLIVACYTGQTAGQATAILRALGFNAVSMQGGMRNGWEAKEMPVVK